MDAKPLVWIGLAVAGVLLFARKASAAPFGDGAVIVADGVLASWYGPGLTGNLTANGERFDPNGMTAAHRTLPFNTVVNVLDLDTNRSVNVRINDRGPFAKDPDGTFSREIDLAQGAAAALGIIDKGLAAVTVTLVS